MKKTTKSPKRPKSAGRSTNWGKVLKPLGLVVLGLVLVAGVVVYTYYPMSRITKATNDQIFCAGADPTTGDDYIVKLSVNIKDQGHVRVFKTTKKPPSPPEMKYQDLVAAIEYQGPNNTASRVNLRLSGNENLQVFRQCGAQPACRLEVVHHLAPEELARSQAELKLLEKEYSHARKDLDKKTAAFNKTKKKKNSKNLITASLELQKNKARVDEFARQLKKVKDLVASQGTDMQKIELTPAQTDDWCPETAH